MLIHAMILWPEIIQDQLWPFALRLAVDLHNCTPGPSGLTPEEVFIGIKGCNRLQDFHPFSCPVFALDPSLQQGHKIPHWKPCSRVGVYLGLSLAHATSVPLVLSTLSGLISPQFHVVFDDYFTTTQCLHNNSLPSNWPDLLSTSSEKLVDDTFDSTNFIDSSWFSDSTPSQREDTLPTSSKNSSLSFLQREDTSSSAPSSQPDSFDTSSSLPPCSGWNLDHNYSTHFKKRHLANIATFHDTSSIVDTPFDESLYKAFIAVQDSFPIHSSTYLSFLEHYACASHTNPNVLHYSSMLCDPDQASFELDLQREMNDLLCTNTAELAPRSAVLSTLKVLQAIWSFCRKRAPNWSILKFKSRLCAPMVVNKLKGSTSGKLILPLLIGALFVWYLF
jgi:hypothetical protein